MNGNAGANARRDYRLTCLGAWPIVPPTREIVIRNCHWELVLVVHHHTIVLSHKEEAHA